MTWFKRIKDGIVTRTIDKKETPDGLWGQCKFCKKAFANKLIAESLYVCPHCSKHLRIGPREYFSILFDESKYDLLFEKLYPTDALQFEDLKKYKDRIESANKKSNSNEAIEVGVGEIEGQQCIAAVMDFSYIGGSMGSVVGEKIALSVDIALKHELPVLIISKSGGARMMESGFSLMQMAKTSTKIAQLSKAKLPYISLLTDPTTGGVSASFAMLGDVILAEPEALIGFAGPRVVKETIKRDLPEGFQRSEFLLEKGFVDKIVHRAELKATIAKLFNYMSMTMTA
ncbi:UNVERIFIED_CONTAM: hypothetical protein GTU68_048929 [Idotea baltica]|nr:hypothetical protein [Idotea baltica]